jgi:glutaminase
MHRPISESTRAKRVEQSKPTSHPLADYLAGIHDKHSSCNEGAVASYIPELTKADPNWFGIAVATIDGHVYEVGDTRQAFTIQSISKPFTYALAMQDHGLDPVLKKIGVEPSGDAFNSISLHRESGRPFNPMINAGAIASTGLVKTEDGTDRIDRILDLCSKCAGRELTIDEEVYRSERDTGFRNFAIGFMLRNFGILESSPEPVLDAYFRQCSILVTCRDLAVMAATLANGGVCPLTGEEALDPVHVPQVLSVMASCGMYDYAGEWVYRIGMPSKSGVGGGIIGVLPGHMAIAVFSPLLDARGNSVRGIRVFDDLSNDFRLHMFRSSRPASYVVRRRYDAASVSSKRLRRPEDSQRLRAHGDRINVFELQGELDTFSAERVIRDLLDLSPSVTHLVINFRRVLGADRPAVALFLELFHGLRERFTEIVLSEYAHVPLLAESFGPASTVGPAAAYYTAEETDTALELCENALLTELGAPPSSRDPVRLEHFEVCASLDAASIEKLRGMLRRERYAAGDLIIRRDDPATCVYFLMQGQVSVLIDLPSGAVHRLATCMPGMLFGEMAILERLPRSAAVRADEDVECLALDVDSFDRLSDTQSALKVKLLENFARSLSNRVRKLTDEVGALNA